MHGWEAEGCDSSTPLTAGLRYIFGRIPEGAVVGWVDRHAAVVAPSERVGLRASVRRLAEDKTSTSLSIVPKVSVGTRPV